MAVLKSVNAEKVGTWLTFDHNDNEATDRIRALGFVAICLFQKLAHGSKGDCRLTHKEPRRDPRY